LSLIVLMRQAAEEQRYYKIAVVPSLIFLSPLRRENYGI
jgi:hypothetical protein